MKKNYFICGILISGIIALTACTHRSPEASSPVLVTNLPPVKVGATDSNNDGNIDINEFNSRLETLFEERDVDDNGQISQSELPNVNLEAYDAADQDGIEGLTEKEYIFLRLLDFKRVDVDDNEVLYPHEILRW